MRVAILGCGYVGIELGRRLSPAHDVVGVRRSTDGVAAVEAAGLRAVAADVTDADSLAAIPPVDAVVFAASAGGRDAAAARETYVEGQRTAIDALCGRADAPDRYLYTSSIGVYGDRDGAWVDEETALDPATPREQALVDAESVARKRPREYGVDGGVARLAGIYGPDRHRLDRYLEGPVAAGYLNLIHRADAAGAVAHLLETDAVRTDVVLVVDDEPVDRWTLADWLADACGEPSPPKDRPPEEERRPSKRCANDKLHRLGYELSYPTYREGYQAAIEAYRQAAEG